MLTDRGMTVTVAEPVFPSLVAVIDAVPSAAAVTVPLSSTDATEGLDEVHVVARPVRTLFPASLSTAVARVVLPCSTEAAPRVTATVATAGGFTKTVAVACWPPLAAVIVAVPTDTPVTSPGPVTEAMARGA